MTVSRHHLAAALYDCVRDAPADAVAELQRVVEQYASTHHETWRQMRRRTPFVAALTDAIVEASGAVIEDERSR